jgi:phosphoribosylformylglycinamidine cyclo-ligase
VSNEQGSVGVGEAGGGASYALAGVDVEAGDRAVELMRAAVTKTHQGRVLGGFGGFAGLFDAGFLRDYRDPILATSTDGVGTKVAIAQALDLHDTIGADLVAMVVDDIVVSGARPLFMTDYIACGKVHPERIAKIVAGIANGCQEAGCALIGGETAEHPGLLGPDEYDLAGAATGVVERDQLLGPHRIESGDVVLAIESSGLHSNGYSLVRHILRTAGWSLERHVPELGRTIGEELLTPTRIYAGPLVDLAESLGVGLRAISHVTGGGLAANLGRVLPAGSLVRIDRSKWRPAPIFELLGRLGSVPVPELERTLNLGVGMVLVLAPEAVDSASAALTVRGWGNWVLGTVRNLTEMGLESGELDGPPVVTQGAKGVDGGSVSLVGRYPNQWD